VHGGKGKGGRRGAASISYRVGNASLNSSRGVKDEEKRRRSIKTVGYSGEKKEKKVLFEYFPLRIDILLQQRDTRKGGQKPRNVA